MQIGLLSFVHVSTLSIPFLKSLQTVSSLTYDEIRTLTFTSFTVKFLARFWSEVSQFLSVNPKVYAVFPDFGFFYLTLNLWRTFSYGCRQYLWMAFHVTSPLVPSYRFFLHPDGCKANVLILPENLFAICNFFFIFRSHLH